MSSPLPPRRPVAFRPGMEPLEDRSVPATLLTSTPDFLGGADASSVVLGVSDDGQTVLIQSTATNIIPGQIDTPDTADLFWFNRRTGERRLVTARDPAPGEPFLPGTKSGGVSVSTPGVRLNAVLSGDGKSVAFLSGTPARSYDSTLAPVVDGGGEDVYVWNSVTTKTTLASRDKNGFALGSFAGVGNPSISNDGAAVGFVSTISSWLSIDSKFLVAPMTPDPEGTPDLYRAAVGKTPFPVTFDEIVTPQGTFYPHFQNVSVDQLGRFMSGDGVTFVHVGLPNPFLGTVSSDVIRSTFAGRGLTGDPIDTLYTATGGFGTSGVISGNAILARDRGDVVLFTAKVPLGVSLVPGYVNLNASNFDLYRGVFTGTGVVNELITIAAGTANSGQNGLLEDIPGAYQITPEGRFTVFTSTATNLVAGLSDQNKAADVFQRDTVNSKTFAVSVTANNANRTGFGTSRLPSQTSDGLQIAFESTGNNFTTIPDENLVTDIFVRDRLRNTTALASVIPGNFATANARSFAPVIGGSTRSGQLYFTSEATDVDRDFTVATGVGQIYVSTTPIAITDAPREVGFAGGSRGFAAIGGLDLDGNVVATNKFQPFPGYTGDIRAASADVNNDGVLDLIVGAGPGGGPRVLVIDGFNGRTLFDQFVFESSFRGGVYVAGADMNGDGRAEVIVGAGEGGAPRFRVLDSVTGVALFDLFGYESSSRTGVRVSTTDLNGDAVPDMLLSAGMGGGPRVRVLDGTTLKNAVPTTLVDFFTFESSQRGGAYVGGGDFNGDGIGDIAVGAGPEGGPRVIVWDGTWLRFQNPNRPATFLDFFAFDPDLREGVRVTLKDIDGDGIADLVVGSGGGLPRIKTYLGGRTASPETPLPQQEFVPFGETFGSFGAWVG